MADLTLAEVCDIGGKPIPLPSRGHIEHYLGSKLRIYHKLNDFDGIDEAEAYERGMPVSMTNGVYIASNTGCLKLRDAIARACHDIEKELKGVMEGAADSLAEQAEANAMVGYVT